MDIIKQIAKSRQILKEVLSEGYDTDTLPIYSIDETDKLFSIESSKNPFSILSHGGQGQGNACNFSVNHRIIKDHQLHVLYYNFQKDGKTKVTKTVIDKIKTLYNDDIIQPTDNIVLILNENIKETIQNINNTLNLHLKDDKFDIKNNDIQLEKKHFRNVFMFDIKTLQFNILKHKFVPKHEVVRDNDSIQQILKNCNCSIDQLPIISKEDPVSKIKMCIPGDICKITRHSKTSGDYIYYRVCR